MRIMHTSDWHLGNKWKDCSRENEFRAFLSWFLEIIREKQPDIVLICGDIFDTSTPSDGTVRMFHQFLSEAAETTSSRLVLIGGNHDGVAQLEASVPLLERYRATLISSLNHEQAVQQSCLQEIKDAQGNVAGLVCAVPFLRVRDVSVSVSQTEVEQSYVRGVELIYRQVAESAQAWKAKHPHLPVVGTGHLAVCGVAVTDSTRRVIGYVDAADASIFSNVFDYVALGHIHKGYSLDGGRIRYCGSPLPMGQDEAEQEHRVVLVDIAEDGQRVSEDIPVPVFVHYVSKNCSDRAELEALNEALPQLAPRMDVPSLSLDVTYTGTDLTAEQSREYTDAWQKLPYVVHGRILRIRRGGLMSVCDEQIGTLTDYTPMQLFEQLLRDKNITDECERRELCNCMATVLNELSDN